MVKYKSNQAPAWGGGEGGFLDYDRDPAFDPLAKDLSQKPLSEVTHLQPIRKHPVGNEFNSIIEFEDGL